MWFVKDDGLLKQINVSLTNRHLNIIDPEALPDFEESFIGGGYLYWSIPKGTQDEMIVVFAFSIAESPSFGAAQTLLGNYTHLSRP